MKIKQFLLIFFCAITILAVAPGVFAMDNPLTRYNDGDMVKDVISPERQLTVYDKSRMIEMEISTWHRLYRGQDDYLIFVKRTFADKTVITDSYRENNEHYRSRVETNIDGVKTTDIDHYVDGKIDERYIEKTVDGVLIIDEYHYGDLKNIYQRTRRYYDAEKQMEILAKNHSTCI